MALMPVASGSLTLFALHDAGRLQLEGTTPGGVDGAQAVDRGAGGVDHAAEVALADGDGEDLTGAADLLALRDAGELAEDHDADLAELEVQRKAELPVLEADELVGHDVGQALDTGDAVGRLGDAADLLAVGGACLVGGHGGVQGMPDVLRADRELSHRGASLPLVVPSLREVMCGAGGCAAARGRQDTRCSRAWDRRARTVAS